MILILRLLNPALRFLLEVAMMLALAYWGESSSQTLAFRLLLGLALPLLAMVLWGLLVAPKASFRLADPWRLLLELILFGLAALAL